MMKQVREGMQRFAGGRARARWTVAFACTAMLGCGTAESDPAEALGSKEDLVGRHHVTRSDEKADGMYLFNRPGAYYMGRLYVGETFDSHTAPAVDYFGAYTSKKDSHLEYRWGFAFGSVNSCLWIGPASGSTMYDSYLSGASSTETDRCSEHGYSTKLNDRDYFGTRFNCPPHKAQGPAKTITTAVADVYHNLAWNSTFSGGVRTGKSTQLPANTTVWYRYMTRDEKKAVVFVKGHGTPGSGVEDFGWGFILADKLVPRVHAEKTGGWSNAGKDAEYPCGPKPPPDVDAGAPLPNDPDDPVGDLPIGHDQALFINQSGSQGRVLVADFSDGAPPVDSGYLESYDANLPQLNGWHDPGDAQLVGDFRGLGHDQALFINRSTSTGGRVRIADFADGAAPSEAVYLEDYGTSDLLNGWHEPDDALLAGDFLGTGHDQVMFVNRSGSQGRVLIADFANGATPAQPVYWENYDDSPLLGGWHDAEDALLVGDFRGLGHDQVMFINRSGSQGRVLIADFSDGVAPAEVVYWENYVDSALLGGWHDADDALLAGDFRGTGHDQVLFINRTEPLEGGRVLIADFSDGAAPAEAVYWENHKESPLLDGWHDADDAFLAGDFRDSGHDQVMFINRSGAGGRVLIADFAGGVAPAKTVYWENYVDNALLGGWHDPDDIILRGRWKAASP